MFERGTARDAVPRFCFAAPGTAEIRLEKFLANPPCKLAGGVKEWVVRLPAALGGVGVLASYFLGRDFYTACVGAIAAMVLAALFQRYTVFADTMKDFNYYTPREKIPVVTRGGNR